MVATTGLALWHRLGLPRLVQEPIDSDNEPIINPPPIVDINAETQSLAVPPLHTTSPQTPVTRTYQYWPRALPMAPHSTPQTNSIEMH